MNDPEFAVLAADPKQHAAAPAIRFRLRVRCEGEPIEAMVLRAQIRIEPQWRAYEPAEEPLLEELFGTPDRWGKTLHALAWADLPVMVPAFAGETEVDVNVPCTFDFDVTASRFFSALQDGEIPLRFFFSGSIFRRSPEGFSAEPVSWSCECAYRMPLSVWRAALRACFGDSALIRVDRETFHALHRLRARTGATNWDDVFAALIAAEGTCP